MQMTRATFATWIRPLQLARIAGQDGTRQATILCPNAYVHDLCQHRLEVRIRSALAGTLCVQPDALEVQYVVQGDDAPAFRLEAMV